MGSLAMVGATTGSGKSAYSPLGESPEAFFRSDGFVVTSGADVLGWGDQSGNGHTLAVGTSPELITNSHNGQPGIEFDATNSEYLQAIGGSIITAETEVWVVFKKNSNVTGGTFVDAQSTNHTASVQQIAEGDTFSMFTTNHNTTTDTVAVGAVAFITAFFSTAGTDAISINDGTPDAVAIDPPSGTGITVGARGGVNSNFFDGVLYEIMITPQLTGVNRTNYLNYLVGRYG